MATGPHTVRISKVKEYSWNILFNSSFTSTLRKQHGPITDRIRVLLRYSKKHNAILFKLGNYPEGRKFNATISLNSVITESFNNLEIGDLMKLLCGSYCPKYLKLKGGEYWGVFLDEKNEEKKAEVKPQAKEGENDCVTA